jgi:hypothetical protein
VTARWLMQLRLVEHNPIIERKAAGAAQGLGTLEHRPIQQTPVQALAAEDCELQLRHVEPASVPRRVVELQPLNETPYVRWREGLIQGGRRVGAERIGHHCNRSRGIVHVTSARVCSAKS